jgi:hypothetical protein
MNTVTETAGGRSRIRGRRRHGVATLIAVVALAASILWVGSARGDDAPIPVAVASHNDHANMMMGPHVVAPAYSTDGALTITIPRGTDAAMHSSGDAAYHLPSVIRLTIGDTMVIRNDDVVPHMILYTFLMPGERDTRVFTTIGSEAYSSGCAANAASFHDFTTIFVVAPSSQ